MISKLLNWHWKLKRHFTYLPFPDACRFGLLLLARRTKTIRTSVDGIPITLRSNSPDLLVAISSFAKDEYGFIQCVNPSFIVDAGANIGTSSISFARRFPSATILAVEMEENNLSILRENVKDYQNIKVVNCALSGSSGERSIQNRFTGEWGYTIAETTGKTESLNQKVVCLTIDELMKEHELPHIDILKIDIEGAEKEIFESGGNWLEQTKTIAVELHDRICMGCSRAFYLATTSFEHFEIFGEKVLASKTSSTKKGNP